ncbi:peptide ligase PGM1-related protein [Streptomyces bikiniensis]|uniref:Peptide ligase PGM1-related protein n=1 Tax=Streptomyces bikiniensis TaxID=1896 RepID=A0ABW8D064_STRBI
MLRAWAEQAPREAWLLRPGDALDVPVAPYASAAAAEAALDVTGGPGALWVVEERIDVARSGAGDPARATGKVRAPAPYPFAAAVERLHRERLAYDPVRGEGIVLYAGPPLDGLIRRYAAIAGGHAGVARYEEPLRAAWTSAPGGSTARSGPPGSRTG